MTFHHRFNPYEIAQTYYRKRLKEEDKDLYYLLLGKDLLGGIPPHLPWVTPHFLSERGYNIGIRYPCDYGPLLIPANLKILVSHNAENVLCAVIDEELKIEGLEPCRDFKRNIEDAIDDIKLVKKASFKVPHIME